jgi:hypothetical protein
MNPGTATLIAASLIALLAGCATPPTPASDTGARPAASAKTADLNGPEATLKKGMPAEAARAIMGEPSETRPMKTPAGQAEIWVYRRRIQGAVQQVMVGMKSTPIVTVNNNTGQATVLQTIDEPILRQQAEIIEETVNLLIFDGKYIEQSRSVQRHLEYQ